MDNTGPSSGIMDKTTSSSGDKPDSSNVPPVISSQPVPTAPPPSYDEAIGIQNAEQIQLNASNTVNPHLPSAELDELTKKDEEKKVEFQQATAPSIPITEQPILGPQPITQAVYSFPVQTQQPLPTQTRRNDDCIYCCIYCNGDDIADCCYCLYCCADHATSHTHTDGVHHDGCTCCGDEGCCDCCKEADCDCNCGDGGCCGGGDGGCCDGGDGGCCDGGDAGCCDGGDNGCDCGDGDCDCGDCNCDCGDCVIL